MVTLQTRSKKADIGLVCTSQKWRYRSGLHQNNNKKGTQNQVYTRKKKSNISLIYKRIKNVDIGLVDLDTFYKKDKQVDTCIHESA